MGETSASAPWASCALGRAAGTPTYERGPSNTLAMYPINRLALHGVSVRAVTPHQRRFVALVGDLQNPLFDPAI